MGPLARLVLAFIVFSAPNAASAAPQPSADGAAFETQASDLLLKAGAAFVTHKQGEPTLAQALQLPRAPQDPAQLANHDALKALLVSAGRAQEGCQAPCTAASDIALYRGKIELIAQKKLSLDPARVKAAIENYLPRGVPRIRTAPADSSPSAPGARESGLLDAEVVERLMTSPATAAAVREGLGRKALDLAKALGSSKEIRADAQGYAVLPDGQRRRLTAEQITALNRVPSAQASYLKRLAAAPPPPTSQEKSDKVMQEVDKLIEKDPGRVRGALHFWKSESQDPNGNPLWRGYAYFNRGLLTISGLADVEESAARFGYASADNDVTTRRTVWEGFKTFGNAGLFAANFVGLSGGASVLKGAKAIDNPVVVEGIEQLSKKAAQEVAAHSASVSETVATALAKGGKRNYKAATEAMNDYARTKLGGVIRVEQGGKMGQADFIAKEMKIAYSPLVGTSHEFAHAGQMFVNRANALEITAQKAGKTAAQLTPAEVEQAMGLASRFEKAYYMQHEAQALRSSGFMGLFPGSNYATKLTANGRELTSAMLGAPKWDFTRGQKVFGALSGLGDSQLKIAASVVPVFNTPYIKDEAGQTIDIIATEANTYLPAPGSGDAR